MDTNQANNKKFTNHTNWNLGETSIENQVLHDSIPFTTSSPFPSYPFHHHHHHQIPTPAITEEFDCHDDQEREEELGAMKEMMYRIAAMQPVDIDPATIHKPKRRNVRISDDPQSVAARHRRERISEKIRILQRLVPGGTKMDTASMLDEAIRYVKFLKRQIRLLQCSNNNNPPALAAPSNVGEHDWHAAYNNPNSVNFGEPLCFNDHEVINQSVINGMK